MALDAILYAVQRQSMEQERARLEARLQQGRRMETVGALASGVAHNFNNIVGAILGYTEMAEAQVEPDSRPAHSLGEIRRAGERARDLVDQIMTFGRRRDSRRRPTDVRTLIAESAALLRASLPPATELVVREAPSTAIVSAEPVQLQQVILNLCINAAQAMDGVGRVDSRGAGARRRSAANAQSRGRRARSLRVHRGQRRRPRHGRSDLAPNLRTVLHDTIKRERLGSRDGARDRTRAWGSHECSQHPERRESLRGLVDLHRRGHACYLPRARPRCRSEAERRCW